VECEDFLGAFFFGRAEKKPGFPLQSFLPRRQKRISAAIPGAWAGRNPVFRIATGIAVFFFFFPVSFRE
jgi:hypothetical protein